MTNYERNSGCQANKFLIAMNRLDELEIVLNREPCLRAITDPIVANRLNLTDRRLEGL